MTCPSNKFGAEITLPNYGCCCLSSLVLPNFVKNGSFDWDLFREQIHVGIRFLDNTLATTSYPLWEIKQVSTDERRIGLGFLGLHHAMLLMGLQYSSEAGMQFAEDLCRFMCRESYIASSNLAVEKGSFPKYDRDKFLASNFIQERVDDDVKQLIYKQGIRNVACLMVAPTGTTSLIARVKTGPVWSHGTSSGIEPLHAIAYERLIREKDGYKKTKCVHAAVVGLYKAGFKNFEIAESGDMIDPEKHFEIQARCAQYIDNSISKTILLPENYSEEDLSRLWLHYGKLVTGTTVYRDGTYGKQPITPLQLDNKVIEEAIIEEINEGCASGQCS